MKNLFCKLVSSVAIASLLLCVAQLAFSAAPAGNEYNSRDKVGTTTIEARITINGDGTGCYVLTDGSRGEVTYTYHASSNGPQGPKTPGYYTGTWRLGTQSGTFRWNLYANGNAFTGSWYDDAGNFGGPWNGQR